MRLESQLSAKNMIFTTAKPGRNYKTVDQPDGEDGPGRRELLEEHGLRYIRGQVSHVAATRRRVIAGVNDDMV